MKKEILNNGVKLIHINSQLAHTSFCIGFEAGANKEDANSIGVAHALEHVLFKGTKNHDENYINKKLDEIFAMNNAMTNFPYAIYYGVVANDDFEEGFGLYSDILLNPSFLDEGFENEMSVIKEESKEWSEDLEQHCEDMLLKHSINNERISEIIIGKEKNIEQINLQKLKAFYDKFYVAGNISICVVSSIPFEIIKKAAYKNFAALEKKSILKETFKREGINSGLIILDEVKTDSSKIQKVYDISKLSLYDITLLRIFNMFFGEGVSSILYDDIRTKRGLAYEVQSYVKFEKGISLFKIEVNTSKKHRDEVLKVLDSYDSEIDKILETLDEEALEVILKRYKLKLSLDIERSIVLANRTCIYDLMFSQHDYIFKELNLDKKIDIEYMKNLIKSVMKNGATLVLE